VHDYSKTKWRHKAGRFIVARSERGEDGDADQFVNAQDTATDIFERGPDDRITEDDRADHGAETGDHRAFLRLRKRGRLLEKEVNNVRIDDEDQPDDSLGQAHGGVLVIVTATLAVGLVIVFVLTAENGSLHSDNRLNYSGDREIANGPAGGVQ